MTKDHIPMLPPSSGNTKADRAGAERRIRLQTALAECAQALLASQGGDRLDRALMALLTATQATYVFVERNVEDSELGFCSVTIAEVEESSRPEPENEYWARVPWDSMPVSRSHLSAGDPFVVIPEELEGPEFELYAADPYPIKSELDIPIFVDGHWEGLVGFADSLVRREWTDDDLVLLTTAAQMIGAFWERELARSGLQEALQAKQELLAIISHELRNPLTSVLGLAGELAERITEFDPEESAELAAVIYRAGQEMAFLIEDLLVAARADFGEVNIESGAIQLADQVRGMIELLGNGVHTEHPISGEAVAWADPVRVRQIVRNLLTNADRYGGPDRSIGIASDAAAARLIVRDDGPGVPEEDRESIFEPYRRAGDAARVDGSVGLGLSVSRRLARLMGGDLTYDYVDGRSEFCLSLPVAEASRSSQAA